MDDSLKATMAEQAVIGAIIQDNSLIDDCELAADDFYHQQNRAIFGVIRESYDKGDAVDIVALQSLLTEKGLLDDVGGLAYIFQLMNHASTVKVIFDEHARIVQKKSLLRQIEQRARDTLVLCHSGEEPEAIMERLQGLSITQSRDKIANISDVFKDNHREIEEKLKNPYSGLPTKYVDIDALTGGLQKSDLIILAARPSMGKTALALNIASNVALKGDGKVLVFSIEMSAGQLVNRVVSALKLIPSQHLLRPKMLTDEEWDKYWEVCNEIESKHLDIFDDGNVTPAKIRKVAKSYKAKNNGIDLIVIDYLQLIHSNRETGNKVVEVGEVTRDLKLLARELDVPIILLSQLSRGVEAREDKRPLMSDLRDSGSIEQDADIVAFLYREGYYDKEFQYPELSELIFRKHRNGPLATVYLMFKSEFTLFGNATARLE